MALEKVEHEVASEELVIQEVAKELKTVKADILDSLSSEQKSQANPSAIVEDRESQQQLTSVESLSDKEKLKEIQKSFQDMNTLLRSMVAKQIFSGDYTLSITDDIRGDAGFSTKAYLKKSGKEVFAFELGGNMFHKERGNDYPVNGVMKVAGERLYYHGDDKYNHGIYENYDVLINSQPYQKIIKDMITSHKNKKTSVKK